MGIKEEEEILRKAIPDYEELSAAELSRQIILKVSPQEQRKFMEANRRRMRYCVEAEEELRRGRVKHAMELLEYALSMGYYGREYPYGLLGDAYQKMGDVAKALEMYKKSGSHDSLRKARQLGYKLKGSP
jgi:tetratricopeptide (TPR) repeat protein